MTTLFALFMTLFLACGEKSNDTSSPSTYACPTVESDSCMTEEVYEECLAVVENCESGNIVAAYTCPYTIFDCVE